MSAPARLPQALIPFDPRGPAAPPSPADQNSQEGGREGRLEELRQRLKGMAGGQMGAIKSQVEPEESRFSLSELAGRLVEVSEDLHGAATTTAATTWLASRVAEAHRRGDTAAWILCSADEAQRGQPYPPDLAEQGVDLAALPIVRARDAAGVLQAADVLLRSGGFGLVIAEWPRGSDRPPEGALGRLLGLCQKHDAALVWLTDGEPSPPAKYAAGQALSRPSDAGRMGALISLRLEVKREAYAPDRGQERLEPGRVRMQIRVSKDKRRGPGQGVRQIFRVPQGMW